MKVHLMKGVYAVKVMGYDGEEWSRGNDFAVRRREKEQETSGRWRFQNLFLGKMKEMINSRKLKKMNRFVSFRIFWKKIAKNRRKF